MRYTEDEKKRLNAWDEWLRRFNWSWFVHLTFDDEVFNGEEVPVSSRRAITLVKRFTGGLGSNVRYFWVLEQKPLSKAPHVHCLIGPTARKPVWEYGINKVEPYDPSRPGTLYISKEVCRGAEWDANLPQEQMKDLDGQVSNGL